MFLCRCSLLLKPLFHLQQTQPPKSFEQLIEAVVSGPYDYPDEAANMERGLRNVVSVAELLCVVDSV